MKNSFKGILCVGAAALAFAALMTFYWQSEPDGLSSPEHDQEHDELATMVIRLSPDQIAATELNILPVRPKKLQIVHTLPARIILNGNRYAHVTTEASGVAREVRKDLGDSVQAGEVLAVLESRDIAEAKANYLAALRRESLAKGTSARERQLHLKQVSAQADYLMAENNSEQATIERQLMEQKLLAIGLTVDQIAKLPETPVSDLRLYALLAPFAGTVVERDISPGELIPAGREPYVIADLSTVWVDIGVHGKDIDKLKKGQEIQVSNPHSQQTQTANIIYLSPLVDSETRSARAIAELDDRDGLWRPGTYVQAQVATESKGAAVTLPKGSIQRINGDDVVFVQHNEGLKPQVVEIGVCDGEDIEIVKGLSEDDHCATSNTFVLKSEMLKSEEDD